jgi:hypothetical protein
MRDFAMLRTKLAELERRVHAFFAGAGGRGVAARWILAILLFLVAVAFLLFLSWLLRGAGLWGDLAFAIIVTTGVFWIARRLAEPLLHEGPIRALPRALATTVFVLIGVPVGYVTRPLGIILLLLPIAVWAGVRIARWRWGRPSWRPVFWQAEVAGVALLAIVLLVAPAVGTVNRVPKAVPAASTERGELDAAVAQRFRPLLLFDSGEQRYPLDIQDAIAGNRMEICRKAVRDDLCERVALAEEIDENLDYLELSEAPGTPRGGSDGSAYYYHVVREGDRVYVDYWWFYSRNPSPVADKLFCGPGLRLPPITCQEHSGDWEGLTVVLAACEAGAEDCEDVSGELLGPEEVRYGQHEHVVGYDWDETLGPFWRSLQAPGDPVLAEAWSELVLPAVDGAGARPVAFVARDSHASYPAPCFRACRQETPDLPEARHDGTVPWAECRL